MSDAANSSAENGGRASVFGLEREQNFAALISAVVFDCYGTLMDLDERHFIGAFGEICTAAGLSISGKELWDRWLVEGRRLGEERGRDRENPLSRPESPFLPFRELWTRQFEEVFRALGCEADPARGYARMNDLLSAARIYAEVPEVLAALHSRYQLAVLSNADEEHLQVCLARNGLVFGTVISSESAASYKPFPSIFRQAAELLDLEPARILYVGDSPIADLLGARSAAMRVAWVNRGSTARPERIPEPDLEIRDLRGLLPALLPEPSND